MSLERLGIFNQYGLIANSAARPQAPDADATGVLLEKTAITALLRCINEANVCRAHFLGAWRVSEVEGITSEKIVNDIQRCPDWQLRLDTWAWAPQSIVEIPATRITLDSLAPLSESPDVSGRVQTPREAAVLTRSMLLDFLGHC